MARVSETAQVEFSFGARPAPGPSLLVLPDSARVEEWMLRAALAGNGIANGESIWTVAELERALIEAANGPLRVASPTALELVYKQIARDRTPQGSPWYAVRETPGFAHALRDLAAALGQGMVDAKAFAQLVPQLDERAQRRLLALSRLLEHARDELRKVKLCDKPTALRGALAALREELPLPARLRGVSSLRFEAVLDWPPLRLEMLFALAERLGRAGARVTLALPYWPDRKSLADDPLAPVISVLEKSGASTSQEMPELDLRPLGDDGPLGSFRSKLFPPLEGNLRPGEIFTNAWEPADEKTVPDVSLASCASPSAEAREAARRCADLLDRGAAPDTIAIAVRSLAGGASEELAFALDQLGIPWRERRGRPAISAAPVSLALSLYELIERHFPREPLAALLSSRLLWMREPGEWVSGEAIAARLQQARVRDDRADGGIAATLTTLAARLRNLAEAPLAPGAHAPAFPDRELREVEEVRARCLRAMDALRALPARATLRAHGNALLALLARWELGSRARRSLDESPEGPSSSKTHSSPLDRAAQAAQLRSLAGLDELNRACEMLASAARELGQESMQISQPDWAQLLASVLSELSLPPAGARGAAVQLVELRELPGRAFAHLIVVGLVEGQLPAQGPIDPLLSDEEKRAINRAAGRAIFRSPARGEVASDGPALPARQTEEPLLFQLGLCAARESILLLWPRADVKGRETPRSSFADEAARALGLVPSNGEPLAIHLPGRIAWLPLNAIPELAACRAAPEMLARASLDAIADPAFRALEPAPRDQSRALISVLARSSLRPELSSIARAALAERERLGTFIGARVPGRFSTQLSGSALDAAQILFTFGPEAPISASQLEQDATCPFRTFGHRVLHLREAKERTDDLSPQERGQLLHACLELFYGRLRDNHLLPLDVPQSEWAPVLRALSDEEMDKFVLTHDVGHRGIWPLRKKQMLDLLEEVVAMETMLRSRPVELERPFGGQAPHAWEPLRIPSPDGSEAVFARGAIDRLDMSDSSRGLPGNARLVIDYKSGRLPELSRKMRSDALLAPEFQLLLYVAAVRAREPLRSVDAAYMSFRDKKRSTTLSTALAKERLSLDAMVELDPARRAEMRKSTSGTKQNLADAVWQRVSRLRAGLMNVDPLECERCDLKPVCRIAALPVEEEAM